MYAHTLPAKVLSFYASSSFPSELHVVNASFEQIQTNYCIFQKVGVVQMLLESGADATVLNVVTPLSCSYD